MNLIDKENPIRNSEFGKDSSMLQVSMNNLEHQSFMNRAYTLKFYDYNRASIRSDDISDIDARTSINTLDQVRPLDFSL